MALEVPAGYRPLDERTLPAWLADHPHLAARLGGEPAAWRVSEVGDGNLNLVFVVEGPAGALCVKQALPYVRLVGESWPLGLARIVFEHLATTTHARFAPERVPEVHHFDPVLYVMVMERLHPHVVMRQGTLEGVVYPRFAEHITDYLARVLFHTSDIALPGPEKKRLAKPFLDNVELCGITEDLIFTDPYTVCARNRWTSPQLDADAALIREDARLRAAVARLKYRFMTAAQALLHGDLHTGSIMVTADSTKVIDAEFAFYGPMGFDVGKLLGNLLLCHFAQAGHEEVPGARDAYRDWLLATVEDVWNGFARKFRDLWDRHGTGDAFPPALFTGESGARALRRLQEDFLAEVFRDALGYAGASMIRRTLGLAHNADLERIEDPDLRAECERLVLTLGRELILHAGDFRGIEEVTARARALYAHWRARREARSTRA